MGCSDSFLYLFQGILTHVTLPGSHHLHLDPHSAPLVAKTIGDFLAAE